MCGKKGMADVKSRRVVFCWIAAQNSAPPPRWHHICDVVTKFSIAIRRLMPLWT